MWPDDRRRGLPAADSDRHCEDHEHQAGPRPQDLQRHPHVQEHRRGTQVTPPSPRHTPCGDSHIPPDHNVPTSFCCRDKDPDPFSCVWCPVPIREGGGGWAWGSGTRRGRLKAKTLFLGQICVTELRWSCFRRPAPVFPTCHCSKQKCKVIPASVSCSEKKSLQEFEDNVQRREGELKVGALGFFRLCFVFPALTTHLWCFCG